MPSYNRFVEPGRFCTVTYGPDEGKQCTIVDVVDHRRVVVDGPKNVTGVARQQIPIRWLALSDFVVPNTFRGAHGPTVAKGLKEGEVLAKFNATRFARRRVARKNKLALTDFERFKVMVAKKRIGQALRTSINKVRKQQH
ncbi:60S ribosomal protein L14, putative [Perkinsus marinus ATCC 50983]|uniref:60S ribosomal protein L14, putative n=1 Tax=Perkinsus marinus (strain ATCC 50983 / TXsc) TaxID=423536 RepID=C5KYS8_PERM5|nr:60S ribosomal protein L14, putative [Perkinsus marinus ATCC 50983]EER10356.1 60S ribosomal protein L14, putative [Perkinsus marinus ATCC 50983]|eukprot:XP_002778561.1 60S ribosomal protein L14, putative [Perkinsus marinus ATCC 50983]